MTTSPSPAREQCEHDAAYAPISSGGDAERQCDRACDDQRPGGQDDVLPNAPKDFTAMRKHEAHPAIDDLIRGGEQNEPFWTESTKAAHAKLSGPRRAAKNEKQGS